MKKLFIIGASVLQTPAIKKGKEMGAYVAVADYNPNAIGISYADVFYEVSTIDEIGIYHAAKKFGADGIMTLATDMPMRSLAYACERLGLTGITYDTAIKSTDKVEMIKAFEANSVAHPWFRTYTPGDDIPHDLEYPLITKPTDNSGSRGVTLVRNESDLKNAISYSSKNGRCGRILIEEFMEGPEVSVEVLIIDGIAHVLQITDKITTGAPHFVEMGHSQPSRLPAQQQEDVRDLACRAAIAVGIQNGPAHVEIIITDHGPKVVEIGARMGGDYIASHLVPLSTGIDMVKATIELSLNMTPHIERKHEKGAAIRYFHAPCGAIQSFENISEAAKIDGVQEITFTKQIGEYSSEICNSSDRIGFVIAQADTPENALDQCEKVLNKIKINIKGVS